MCVALVGGMDRLERHYVEEARRMGVRLKVFSRPGTMMPSKIKNVDAVVIFTNKVSHRAKREVKSIAKSRKIPMVLQHSCGLCTLRDCLGCLLKQEGVPG